MSSATSPALLPMDTEVSITPSGHAALMDDLLALENLRRRFREAQEWLKHARTDSERAYWFAEVVALRNALATYT